MPIFSSLRNPSPEVPETSGFNSSNNCKVTECLGWPIESWVTKKLDLISYSETNSLSNIVTWPIPGRIKFFKASHPAPFAPYKQTCAS